MSRPTITVCIATYNQRRWIAQCLGSITDQVVDADVRIHVGDDCSTDGTSEVVARLAAKRPWQITHNKRPRNLGPLNNMNDLLFRADGDFIARVDGDDYWLPGKLQAELTYLQGHPDCAAVFTNAITVNEVGETIGLFNDVGDARFDLAAMLRRGNFLNNSSILLRAAGKHAFLDVTEPQIDYRAHLWHARFGYLAQLGAPLTAYRVQARGSMVATMNSTVRQWYWEAIQSVPRELVSDADYARGLADFLRRVFYRAVHKHQLQLLREWAPRVMAASPYGTLWTSLLTLHSIARIALKEGVGIFRQGPDGKRLKVAYRR